MSEQEITADLLDEAADMVERSGLKVPASGYAHDARRAARTIRRLEGEVARLRWVEEQAIPDAELGSLVRRIREHPEAGQVAVAFTMLESGNRWSTSADRDNLISIIATLDKAATRRAAEEGERAPSGWRYRMKDGVLEVQDMAHVGVRWQVCRGLPASDLDVVERVRRGVPRGE